MSEVTRYFLSECPAGKVPMHPEDFVALLAWVRAKGERESREWAGAADRAKS